MIRGDTRAALLDYDKAVACGRPLATTYLGRAVARRTLEDVQGALTDCAKALEIDPDLREARTLREQLTP
jgi:tetratricopeptide (TPR) repeat protein